MKTWRLYCDDCASQKYTDSDTTPTQCPTCSGANIRDIMECDCDVCAWRYVRRGFTPVNDFVIGDFIQDGVWRELDLSAVVPAEAANKFVHLNSQYRHETVVGGSLKLRMLGEGSELRNKVMQILIVNRTHYRGDIWVMLDGDRKIEYSILPNALTQANIMILGWMI